MVKWVSEVLEIIFSAWFQTEEELIKKKKSICAQGL